MKKLIVFIAITLFSSLLWGNELIKNGNFSSTAPINYMIDCEAKHADAALFVEETTWNRCLRVVLNRFRKAGGINVSLLLGRSGKNIGVAVKPDTIYEFSFEARGTIPSLAVRALLFHNDETWWKATSKRQIKPTLTGITVKKNWTRYSGILRTSSDTKRIALQLLMWANGDLVKKMNWQPGQFVLIDNVSLKERKPLFSATTVTSAKIAPVAALTVPCQSFFGDKIPFNIRCETEKLIITTTLPPSNSKKRVTVNGTSVWQDDVVEIFFSPETADNLTQLVLSAGGGRYMGNGNREIKNYDSWNGHVQGRTFEFEIPLKLIGVPPGKNRAIRFSIGAQVAGKIHFLPPAKNSFHDVSNFNLLIIDKLADYLHNKLPGAEKYAAFPPGEAVALLRREMRTKAFKKLAERRFLLAHFPVTNGFSLPLEITSRELITSPIHLTALQNEIKALPIAIMNRTRKTENYRIILRPENKQQEIDYTGMDGNKVTVTMRQALSVKDSDTPDAGRIFDPLPKMNEAQTITVAPGETGLVWIELESAKTGEFSGLLRVIPLGETAKVSRKKYQGNMEEIPVKFKVLPYTLKPFSAHGLWGSVESESMFLTLQRLLPSEIMLSPWHVKPNSENKWMIDKIRQCEKWFEKYNFQPKFRYIVGYNVYNAFVRSHKKSSTKTDSHECFEEFQQYLKTWKQVFAKAGVAENKYLFELFDEPRGKNYQRDLQVVQAARKALPKGNFVITWPPRNFGYTPELIRNFIPYVNYHMFHDLLIDCDEYSKLIDEIKSTSNQHFGYYICNTSMRERLHQYYRLIAWKALKSKAEFCHVYIFCEQPWGVPGATNWKAAASGGLILRNGNNAIPTIRMAALREGFIDAAYLELLGDEKFTRQMTQHITSEEFHDPAAPERVREEIIKRLEVISKTIGK